MNGTQVTADARAAPQERWMVALVALYGCVVGIRVVAAASPAGVIWDDGFYYLRIAENLARGLGSTFDGITPTNGYHPLWLLVLVPIARLFPDPTATLRAVIALEIGLMAVSAALVYLVARCVAGRGPSLLAALLWVHLCHRLCLSGLEYALYATVVLTAMAYYLARFTDGRPSRRDCRVLGALLAAAFLARLDAILLAAAVAGTEARRAARGNGFDEVAAASRLATPALTAAIGYAIVNALLFGSPLPVSSLVKRTWSALTLAQDPVYREYGWVAAKLTNVAWPWETASGWTAAVIAGTWGIGLVWLLRRRLGLRRLERFAPFVLFGILGSLGYTLVYHANWSARPWYYVVQPILAVILAAAVLQRLREAATARFAAAGEEPRWWRRAPGAAVAVIVALGVVAVPLRTWSAAGAAGDGAGWIGPTLDALRRLPDDARPAAWNAGSLGYRSRRAIVNLDGLVSSREYFRSQRRDLCAYWRAIGVTHVVDFFDFTVDPPAAPLFAAYRPLYDYSACADRLRLVWADERQPAAARPAIFAFGRGSDHPSGSPITDPGLLGAMEEVLTEGCAGGIAGRHRLRRSIVGAGVQASGNPPEPPHITDDPVAVIKWVDGTVIDTVWKVGR